MPPSPSPIPDLWVSLTLPSDLDLSDGLAELLRSLRVPAAVRYTRLFGSGTIAMVPADAQKSVLAMTDEYGPEVRWTRLADGELTAGLDRLAGPGSLLDGAPMLGEPPENDLRPPTVDDERESPEIPAPSAATTVVAWTTRARRDEIAMLGARYGMVFESTDAGSLGTALRPANEGRTMEAVDSGLWAVDDGIAAWRAGEEFAAAFVRRGDVTFVAWDASWTLIDPSRPGQSVDGSTMADRLRDATARNNDPTEWIRRFRLDDSRASRLRALFRRDPHPEVLDELMTVLGLPQEWLRLLSDSPVDVERIEPRSMRQLISHEPQQVLSSADDVVDLPYRHRHPRTWLALSMCGSLALILWGATGIASGRWTAWGAVAGGAVWALLVLLDDALPRAFRRTADETEEESGRAD